MNTLNKNEVFQRSLDCFGTYNPGVAFWRGVEAAFYLETDLCPPTLDLGCSDGAFGSLIDRLREGSIAGAPDQLRIGIEIRAERLPPRKAYTHFLRADATHMPFRDGSFSTVMSNCVIEHIRDIELAIGEVGRVLKSGGRFYFSVPSVHFNQHLLGASLFSGAKLSAIGESLARRRNRKLDHFNILSLEEWRGLLLEKGLKISFAQFFISSKAQKVIFLIFDIYNFGIARFTTGALINKIDLVFYRLFRIRPSQFIFYKLLFKMFSRELDGPTPKGGGLFISAIKEND